jgi:hypothetical protein
MLRSWSARRLVLVGGIALLGVGAAQGVSLAGQLLQPQAVRQLDERDRIYRCVRDRVERSVPAGSAVFVAPDAGLWDQRVIESTYPRLEVTSVRDAADYLVRVTSSGASCGSAGVTVQRLR